MTTPEPEQNQQKEPGQDQSTAGELDPVAKSPEEERQASVRKQEDATIFGILTFVFGAGALWGWVDWRNGIPLTQLDPLLYIALLIGPFMVAFCLPIALASLGMLYQNEEKANNLAFVLTHALYVPAGIWMAWCMYTTTGKWLSFFFLLGAGMAILGGAVTFVNIALAFMSWQDRRNGRT